MDTVTVEILRVESEPIGLNITGGLELKYGGIFVHSVRPDSLCDGKLKPDDEIKSINDIEFDEGCYRSDAVKVVATSTGKLTITVKRKPYSGNLVKQGAKTKNWKKRYFLLQGHDLAYHHPGKYFTENNNPLGTINLKSVTDVQHYSHSSFPDMSGFSLVTMERTYYLFAETESERQGWIEAISPLIHTSKYGMSQETKAALKRESTLNVEEDDSIIDNEDDTEVTVADGVPQIDSITGSAQNMIISGSANETFCGKLCKSNPNFNNWTDRWFVLDGHVLSYFKEKNGKRLNDIHINRTCTIKKASATDDMRVKKGENYAFVFYDSTKQRDFICCASSAGEADTWVNMITTAIESATT